MSWTREYKLVGKDRLANIEDGVDQIANGGSLPALGSGGPPTGTGYTYATNDVYTDVNGVGWQCTAGGAPGTWRFFGTGFMPGITTNDNTSGTDYGAVINAYMATLGPYQDTPKLPPAAIYVNTEVIPPLGITLIGSRRLGNPLLARGTVLRPLNSGMARVASCSNADSGFRNLAIDGLAVNNAAAATTAFGVYAAHCNLDRVVVMGGNTKTFDSNVSATDLGLSNVTIWSTGGVSAVLTVDGSDWACVKVYVTSGTVIFGGGGNQWDGCHFVSSLSGSATPFTDNGGQIFTGCYFDSMPVGASVLIDRSSAAHTSSYTGCFYFQNVTGLGVTSTVFKETATAKAGVAVTGGIARGVDNTTFGYFIKGAIASTSVTGLKGEVTFQTGFADATPPLGVFNGCMNGGVRASLGGAFPGTNQATRESLRVKGLGVLSEPFNPAGVVSTPLAPTSQTVYGVLVGLCAGDIVAGIETRIITAASGTNPTTVRFGLADSTGKILVLSADRGTAGANDATTVFALGVNKIPFTGPYTVLADGDYFPVYVVNGTWGTTQPLPHMAAINSGNAMLAGPSARPANFGWTGQTDLPAVNSSLTITSGVTRSYYLAPY